MTLLLAGFAAAVAIWIAVYAQITVARFTASSASALLTRAVLLVVGVAFGYVAAMSYAAEPVMRALAFAIGLGAVHLPAAFILFVKRARGAGKS
jgi:hypothetical protein